MPRRNRSKTMKGGFWPFGNSDSSSTSSSSGIGSSVSNWWSSLTGPKKETSSLMPFNNTPASSAYTPAPAPAYTPTPVGGKHKSKRRHMKGGYTSNVPTMSLAGHAAPISGVPNAQPQAWVGKGGRRTRRRNKRHSKSYRKH
jgi:hypothetical protein